MNTCRYRVPHFKNVGKHKFTHIIELCFRGNNAVVIVTMNIILREYSVHGLEEPESFHDVRAAVAVIMGLEDT